jgi:hypothetical protein
MKYCMNIVNYKHGDLAKLEVSCNKFDVGLCRIHTHTRARARVHIYIYIFIHSFIPQSVLREVHGPFQREFSTKCDPVLPLSCFSIFSFPQVHTRNFYPSLCLCFNIVF